MKIYDCFTFFDENLMLELRLNTLDKFVDYFVILECGQTFQDTFKVKQIDESILAKYKDKIRYIYLEDFSDLDYNKFNKNLYAWKKKEYQSEEWQKVWKRESNQRDQLVRGLYDAKPNDIVMVSDVDEIPDLSKINFRDMKEDILALQMDHCSYKFNLHLAGEGWLINTRLCRYKHFRGMQWLRLTRKCYPWWRLDKFFKKNYNLSYKVIKNGWHFSYVMNIKQIVKKLESFSHFEYNNEHYKNPEYIESCISKGIDLLSHNTG